MMLKVFYILIKVKKGRRAKINLFSIKYSLNFSDLSNCSDVI